MQILYVPKAEIYPMLGCYSSNGAIKIREDLPQCVKDFLLDHELLHGDDIANQEGFVEKELESNWGGAVRHPAGAILAVLLSLTPARIKYYIERIKKRE